MIKQNPNIDLESQYTKQIESLFEKINREYLAIVRGLMRQEGIDNDEIRAVKINAFPDIIKKLALLSKKLKSSIFRSSVFDKMAILFENVDKRSKKLVAKIFKDKNLEIPSLKLKQPSAQLENHIKNNVSLIKNITDEHINELTKSVIKAARSGFSPEIVEKEIMRQAKTGLSHARFVSRDQLAKASAAINQERQTSVGIPGYIWIVTNDRRARESHKAHHNKYYTWNNPPVIDFSLDGDFKRSPEVLNPGEDYGCRCGSVPAFGPADSNLLSPRIRKRDYAE